MLPASRQAAGGCRPRRPPRSGSGTAGLLPSTGDAPASTGGTREYGGLTRRVRGSAGLVGEVGTEPALDLGKAEAPPEGVVLDLVPAEASHGEVARLRVGEEQPADAGGGGHREGLGQCHVEPLGVEQVEQVLFLA